jgi:hypothetical protein
MRRPALLLLLTYGAAIFLAAFLLFLIQPLFAKLILPWFGGSSAVWITCMVFFQTALVAGYFYANRIRRCERRVQIAVHIVLLAAAVLILPVAPNERWRTASFPALNILLVLTASLGLPYVLLASTGPLLQSWFAQRFPDSRPYRMYALSNAASLLALAAFPVWVEPRFPSRAQSIGWSLGWAAFAVLSAALAIRQSARIPVAPVATPRSDRFTWIALAATGSMLLVATTNQITQNVAAVPLLWILPLAIYLISFILCFESARWYRRELFVRLVPIAAAAAGYAVYDIQMGEAMIVALPLYSGALFAGCMFCHGELNLRKPPPGELASFYLDIALGGALGAIALGLVAPAIFSGVYDLPVALLALASLALFLNWRTGWPQRLLWATAAVAMAVVAVAQVRGFHFHAIDVRRSFYGSLRVAESGGVRALYHGTVKHGSQFLEASRRRWPTTYYGPPSGAGLAMLHCCDGARRVGVIGLGAGTLAAYGRPGDEIRFYEINPQMEDIARSDFSFLSGSAAAISITIGDGRLALEREPPRNFDVLVVDAFSGDAIPVHLLTGEAWALYLCHLKPGGILALHLSNQYLDLVPVAARQAQADGLAAVIIQSPKQEELELSAATWMLASRDAAIFLRPEIRAAASVPEIRPGRLWTDDDSSLFEAIRWWR